MKKPLVILLSILILLTCGCSSQEKETETDEPIEKVKEEIAQARTAIVFKLLQGNGTVILRDDEKEAAYEGMRLLAGDEVMTDGSSKVYLRVDDDKNILLETDTKMNVKELSDGKLLLELEYGEFFFNVENKLKADEEMSFRIGSTSMSIRGTSGGGSLKDKIASFAIYTGYGALKDETDEEVEYMVLPNTIAHIDEKEEKKSIELASLKKEEVPSLVSEYVKVNKEYKEELLDEGWTVDDKEVIPYEDTVPETEKSESYVGWRQNKDGGWEFSLEDYEKGIGPTYFKEEEKPSKDVKETKKEETKEEVKEETVEENPSVNEPQLIPISKPVIDDFSVTYNGEEHELVINGFNDKTMRMSGAVSGTKAGLYRVYISPKDGYCWKDGTVTMVKGKMTIEKAALYVYLKETTSYDYGYVYSDGDFSIQSISDVIAGDDVNVVAHKDSSITGNNAGSHYIELELIGDDKDNYKIGTVGNNTYVIKKKEISAVYDVNPPYTKVYDGKVYDTDSFAAPTFSNVQFGDTVTYRYNAGDAANVALTLYISCELTGESANNYTLLNPNVCSYSITAKPASVFLNLEYSEGAYSISVTSSDIIDNDRDQLTYRIREIKTGGLYGSEIALEDIELNANNVGKRYYVEAVLNSSNYTVTNLAESGIVIQVIEFNNEYFLTGECPV